MSPLIRYELASSRRARRRSSVGAWTTLSPGGLAMGAQAETLAKQAESTTTTDHARRTMLVGRHGARYPPTGHPGHGESSPESGNDRKCGTRPARLPG